VEREEGFERPYLLCWLLGSYWRMELLVLSLLKWIVVYLVRELRYNLRREIEASNSKA